jgi:hypothetical protein
MSCRPDVWSVREIQRKSDGVPQCAGCPLRIDIQAGFHLVILNEARHHRQSGCVRRGPEISAQGIGG